MPKLLFLAQFAPTNGRLLREPKTPEEKFYAETFHIKVDEALAELNYEYFSTSDIEYFIKNHTNYQLVWSTYNRIRFDNSELGVRNSEVFVQSLCEYFRIPYIGAPPNIRALTEDKSLAKLLAKHIGIKTADWIVASPQHLLPNVAPFKGEYFVKPRFGSGSIGIDESCICRTWKDAVEKSEIFFARNIDIIVEEYIEGVNYSVPVIGTTNCEPLIAVPHYSVSEKTRNIITYAQKRFVDGSMKRLISRDLTLNKQLEYLTKMYFSEMHPCDYARFDFIVEENSGIPYFLETNVLMNLGIHSGFVASFLDEYFSSYNEIIKYIVDIGLEKVKASMER
ncbi:MAG: ATP-grasp domain-containing protein [Defluviitaleaceae bacterium]|nr:ATP-grasp domain-containing protein [Defluviitaleaceae bacterium]